jgi:hypothetical protein
MHWLTYCCLHRHPNLKRRTDHGANFPDFPENPDAAKLTETQLSLLQLGRIDRSAAAEISVTVHLTESFR